MKFTPGEKEAIRLWYEYLRIAQRSSDLKVVAALKENEATYQQWEIGRFSSFNDWWREKRHLFAEQTVVRLVTTAAEADPDVLLVQVPLNKSRTALLSDLRAVLDREWDRLERNGHKGQQRRSAAYTLTEGAEPKLEAIREMLSCYRDVYLVHNPRLRGEALLQAAHSYYLGRQNKRWAKVPIALVYDPANEQDKVRAMRNLRRYIQKAEQIVLNVASGSFPGNY